MLQGRGFPTGTYYIHLSWPTVAGSVAIVVVCWWLLWRWLSQGDAAVIPPWASKGFLYIWRGKR